MGRVGSLRELVTELAILLTLAAGVCLAWPQLAGALALATRIAVSYCFAPH